MKNQSVSSGKVRKRPALTVEGRENQLVSLAYDCAEEQLRSGTASSQTINHFLKLGSSLANLERAKLEREVELMKAKTEAIKSAEETERLIGNALEAFKEYSNQSDDFGDYESYESDY